MYKNWIDTCKLQASNTIVPPTGERIVVLMSGGVDSTVSVHLLREQGLSVIGLTMLQSHEQKGETAASKVAEELGIAHYYVDVADAFESLVIEPFRDLYMQGRTPNPCAICNQTMKFGFLWELAKDKLETPLIATGHYARILNRDDGHRLARAVDKEKDQSYFLYSIPRERLGDIRFPLGEQTKEQTRSIAAELGLSNAEKSESMELCFAGMGDYRMVLSDEQANRPGELLDMQGNVIGEHRGISHYTLGQRKGIGYAGGIPLYVGKIDAGKNTVSLGTREEICKTQVKAQNVNILLPQEYVQDRTVGAKLRSYGEPHRCRIACIGEGTMTICFERPQFAPTPGQKLVLYNENDEIIAGGTIFGTI